MSNIYRERLKINGTPTPFIVTGFSHSKQYNAIIHAIDDGYKIANYGDRMTYKKISGTMRNPDYNMSQVIDYYKLVGLKYNYAEPVSLIHGNYSGEGYIVEMTISLSDRNPAMVELGFMEMRILPANGFATGESYEYPDDGILDDGNAIKNKHELILMQSKYDENGTETSPDKIGISAATLRFSSRYSMVNNNKNIIYYGENPIEVQMQKVIVDADGIYKVQFNELIKKLALSQDNKWSLMYGDQLYMDISIMAISGQEEGDAVNYMPISMQGVATL